MANVVFFASPGRSSGANTSQVRALLRAEDTAAYALLVEVGAQIRQTAIRVAPVSKPDPLAYLRREVHTPGALRASIGMSVGVDARSVFVRIGTGMNGDKVDYAIHVHDGVPAREIRAKRYPVLVFAGANGEVVRKTRVYQTSRPGNPFLRRAAEEVLGASRVTGP